MGEFRKEKFPFVDNGSLRTSTAQRTRASIKKLLYLPASFVTSSYFVRGKKEPLELDNRRNLVALRQPVVRIRNGITKGPLTSGIENAQQIINFVNRTKRRTRRLGLGNRPSVNQMPSPAIGRRVAHRARHSLAVIKSGTQRQSGVDCISVRSFEVGIAIGKRAAYPPTTQTEPTRSDVNFGSFPSKTRKDIDNRNHQDLLTRCGSD